MKAHDKIQPLPILPAAGDDGPSADGSPISISPLGLDIQGDLPFDQWAALAPSLGGALRSMAFVIGDWLVFGEERFGRQLPLPGFTDEDANPPARRVSRERYERARAATGIDAVTLQTYAHVARSVPRSSRSSRLSWEHHRAVAKLETPDQKRWLATAVRERLTCRRMRASIAAGRVLAVGELTSFAPSADPGIDNHIPPINRLAAWWGRAREARFLEGRSAAQLEALLRDFGPVEEMVAEIRAALVGRRIGS